MMGGSQIAKSLNRQMTTRLFIYGTLKRGDCRAPLLADAAYLGQAVTTPRYKLYTHGPYPALVEAAAIGQPGLAIHGELYEVDDATLARLDEEEGVDEGLYERRDIALHDGGVGVQAYFYLRPVDGMTDCEERWVVDQDQERLP